MKPAFSSRFTRIRQGLGDRPTASASSTFVMRPRFCNCERIRRSIRSSLLSVLIAAGSVSHVGGRSMLSRSRAGAEARSALQGVAYFALREHVVERFREALEQHVEVRL